MSYYYETEFQIDYFKGEYICFDALHYPIGSFLCMIGNFDTNVINNYLTSTIQKFVNAYKGRELYTISYKILENLRNTLFEELYKLLNDDFISHIISTEITNKIRGLAYISDVNTILFPSYIYLKELQNICINIIKKTYSSLDADDFNVLTGDSIKLRIRYSDNNEPELYYSINQIGDLVAFDSSNFNKSKNAIKQCENCGKYFIPISRSDEIYCDNLFNKDTGKTCKDIGYEIKSSKNIFRSAYRTAYKTQRARIKYNSHIQDYEEKHFKPWDIAAKEALSEYQTKNDIEGFKEWLGINKDNF